MLLVSHTDHTTHTPFATHAHLAEWSTEYGVNVTDESKRGKRDKRRTKSKNNLKNKTSNLRTTLRSGEIGSFQPEILLRYLHHLIQWGHNFCCCSQLCPYYTVLLLVLWSVVIFLRKTHYVSTLILLLINSSFIHVHNLNISARRYVSVISTLHAVFR
jgi:hypothetical protein